MAFFLDDIARINSLLRILCPGCVCRGFCCQEWFYLGGNWNGQDCRWGKPSLSDVSIFHTEPKSKFS